MGATELSIGFDADDTLWRNQEIFDRAYERFSELLGQYHDRENIGSMLLRTELNNVNLYGYGIKGFTLSAIQTAIQLSEGKIPAEEIHRLLDIGREMLSHPIELLDGVSETLEELASRHRLLLITKGDLRDQERKFSASGLAGFFHEIEVVSEKDGPAYLRILKRHGIATGNFMMVGNSLKSDVLPVLGIGGIGVHLPYHVTWAGEHAEEPDERSERFFKIARMRELAGLVNSWRPD